MKKTIKEEFASVLKRNGALEIGAYGEDNILQQLKTEKCEIPEINLLKIRNALSTVGTILEENLSEGIYVAAVPAGLFNSVQALTVVRLNGAAVEIAAYAKEGLIRQNIAKKAINKILGELAYIN